jgi:hypothetical protein
LDRPKTPLGVEAAVLELGQGFIENPANNARGINRPLCMLSTALLPVMRRPLNSARPARGFPSQPLALGLDLGKGLPSSL